MLPTKKLSPSALAAIETVSSSAELTAVKARLSDLKIPIRVADDRLINIMERVSPATALPVSRLPEEVRETLSALKPAAKRFHGAKVALSWFPVPMVASPCSDKFGYMTTPAVRNGSKLPFNPAIQMLLNQLAQTMVPTTSAATPDSNIPAGFTYFGQFVDHDVTMDVSSSLDVATDAATINNMRTPVMDLDSVYGRGPALDPHLYDFPSAGLPTAIKFQLGKTQTNFGPGGPAPMIVRADFDLPRVNSSTHTAIIGDPRNDENLIVSQFHHGMLRFHNAVVNMLVGIPFPGDIFTEAKKIVTQHYQWAVMNDYLKRICGASVVGNSIASVNAPVGSAFSMPVEFSVAAYRFGHSMIRDQYWVNGSIINGSLGQVFSFVRNPLLPVVSNWVVDFNSFFVTGKSTPVFNLAKSIDSILATGLNTLPGFDIAMANLAKRNLLRGLALGLPSGQAVATLFGVPALTTAQLTQGLPAADIAILNQSSGVLLSKTPLWYYVLREAKVLNGGNSMGPVGARIVADTFVRMLKRDANSYINAGPGWTPFLPSDVSGDFTVADLLRFAGVL